MKNNVKCILINNYAFDRSQHNERDAAQFDHDNLERLFKKLFGYNVIKRSNVSKSELEILLQNEANDCQISREKCDALICVIMTHGASNAIFTSDNQLVKIDDILKYFDGVLEENPKLFIIQACREKRSENLDKYENWKNRKNVFVWQSSVYGRISKRNLNGTLGSLFINCFLCVVCFVLCC